MPDQHQDSTQPNKRKSNRGRDLRRIIADLERIAKEEDGEKPKKKRAVHWGHSEERRLLDRSRSVVVPYP